MSSSRRIILTGGAAVIAVALVHRYIFRRATRTRTVADDSEEDVGDESSATIVDRATVERFPWEPEKPVDLSRKDPSTSDQSTDQQLEFIAQMTFAHSSLRAPSCPCCV